MSSRLEEIAADMFADEAEEPFDSSEAEYADEEAEEAFDSSEAFDEDEAYYDNGVVAHDTSSVIAHEIVLPKETIKIKFKKFRLNCLKKRIASRSKLDRLILVVGGINIVLNLLSNNKKKSKLPYQALLLAAFGFLAASNWARMNSRADGIEEQIASLGSASRTR